MLTAANMSQKKAINILQQNVERMADRIALNLVQEADTSMTPDLSDSVEQVTTKLVKVPDLPKDVTSSNIISWLTDMQSQSTTL